MRARRHRDELEKWRSRLEDDPLDILAAAELRTALAAGATAPAAPALGALVDVLDGASGPEVTLPAPSVLPRSTLQDLLTHPREREERQHLFASLAGRLLHLLEGHETARAVTLYCETPGPTRQPLMGIHLELCRALDFEEPVEIRLAAGSEPVFAPFLDRAPVLLIHRSFLPEASASTPTAELRFLLARSLAHVRRGHTALLQLGPERLENVLLDSLPLKASGPIRLAARAVGSIGVGDAARKAAGWLPERLPGRKAVRALAELLPERGQETVLPDSVHDWVRGWIQGVELTADRIGLLLGGGIRGAASGILRQSDALRSYAGDAMPGLRDLLSTGGDLDRLSVERIRELLRFAASRPYLDYVSSLRPSAGPPAESVHPGVTDRGKGK